MKNNIIISLILVAMASTAVGLLSGCSKDDKYIPDITNKEERQLIKEGNKLFEEGNYQEAEIMYNKATQVNPNSPAANYNLALSLAKQIKNSDNDSIKNDMTAHALSLFELVPTLTKDSTLIAMAFHNMGNLSYENEAYKEAVDAYKQSLRHNPNDNDTRYNLRMAQLKLKEQQQQQQQQDKNQQNQDQQDQDKQNQDKQNQDQQNQDKQDQDKQNQDKQNQDKQNQDKQNQNQDKAQEKPAEQKQQPGKQQDAYIKMDERNMKQVLKAAQDKEDAVQQKINNAGNGQERRERQSSRNKW